MGNPVEAGQDVWELAEGNCYVALTLDHLDVKSVMDRVRSPQAGAIVLFAGTTRDNFQGKPVKELQYTAYNQLALRSMLAVAKGVADRHGLGGAALVHRLGVVPVGEESIIVAVSSPHRQAAWRAGEEALEQCKARVEVWKREEFGGEDGGVWRANRDGAAGVRVDGGAGGGELGNKHEGQPPPPPLGGEGKESNEDDHDRRGPSRKELLPMGPILRHARLGERGHGAVVNPKGHLESADGC